VLARFFDLLAGLQEQTPADAEFLYDARTADGALRLANLRRYLELTAGASTVLVGEAPGWRGATITGVPFMSVREVSARPGLLTGGAEGDGFTLPADPAAAWELSASIVQKSLRTWPTMPVSWPVYPNHPFRAPDPATNRAPRAPEVAAGAVIALELVAALGARRVVAIGRKAERALAAAGVEAVPVRHPAQGGAALFATQMAALGRTGP
jgi:hypothetical protein